MEKLHITYKGYKFKVAVEIDGSEIIINNIVDEDLCETLHVFRNDVFFDSFVGDVIENKAESQRNFVRRVKKSLREFIEDGDYNTPEEVVEPKATLPTPDGLVDKIIYEVVGHAVSSDETKKRVDTLIKDSMKENGVVPHRKILEIKHADSKALTDVGLQHCQFEQILKSLSARVPLALVGPAGSGKTTIVYNASKALNLEFASQSVSAQSTVFDFFGYKDANGKYVSTLFRQKYEKGGVFLLDEFDAGNPNVLAALNQATANSVTSFPDAMIEKHKDFVVVMAGNTFGGGGTLDYVGRNKIDAATLDRFAFIYVDYDEVLESQLATNDDWCKRVQSLRKLAIEKRLRTIISPRATFNGERLLAAGVDEKQVLEMTIFKGMSESERNLLNA